MGVPNSWMADFMEKIQTKLDDGWGYGILGNSHINH